MSSQPFSVAEPIELSDGTNGSAILLPAAIPYRGACALNGHVWLLQQNAPYAYVRDAGTGNLVQKIDLLDVGAAIAAVGARVWIATRTGKIYVFDAACTLLGALPGAGLPLVRRFFVLGPDWLLSTDGGKDVTLWDTTQFAVARTYLGRLSGEEVMGVAAADDHQEGGGVIVATTHALRLYNAEGVVLSELLQGAATICRVPYVDSVAVVATAAAEPRGEGGDSNSSASRNRGSLRVASAALATSAAAVGRAARPRASIWAAHPAFVSVLTVESTQVAFGAAPALTQPGSAAADSASLPSTAAGRRIDHDRRTVPIGGIREIFDCGNGRAGTVDSEGLITLWCARELTPIRAFRSAPALGYAAGIDSFTVLAAEVRTRTFWTLSGTGGAAASAGGVPAAADSGKALMWRDDVRVSEGEALEQQQLAMDLQREEVGFLRRKLYYVESIGTLYRTKCAAIVRAARAEAPTSSAGRSFDEVDAVYEKALTAWRKEYDDREPLPVLGPGGLEGDGVVVAGDGFGGSGPDGGNFGEYWRQRYMASQQALETLKSDQDNLLAILQFKPEAAIDPQTGAVVPVNESVATGAAVDIVRAQFVCRLIKEKNEYRERERLLAQDVLALRHRLHELNSPLGTGAGYEDAGVLREENAALRAEIVRLAEEVGKREQQAHEGLLAQKQNQLLKRRLKELKEAVDRGGLELADQTVQSQRDLDAALSSVASLQRALDDTKGRAFGLERDTTFKSTQLAEAQAQIEQLTVQLDALQRTERQRQTVEASAQAAVRGEVALLCQTLDERDRALIDSQTALAAARTEAQQLRAALVAAETASQAHAAQLSVAQGRIEQLERIVSDRKAYAMTVGELQGRLEIAVDDLRHSFTPHEFAEQFKELEKRVEQLVAMEAQLRHKDDLIALRDDQVETLKQQLWRLQGDVAAVSTVFAQLPRSLEEVEVLLVENDEFRRRLGMDADAQDEVHRRLHELRAARKQGVPMVELRGGKKSDPPEDKRALPRIPPVVSSAAEAAASSASLARLHRSVVEAVESAAASLAKMPGDNIDDDL